MAHLPARRDDLPHSLVPLPDRRRAPRRARPTRAQYGRLAATIFRAFTLALVISVVACAPARNAYATPTASLIAGGVLSVAQASDITSLDPWTASDPATLTVVRQIYEPLVDLEPGGFRVVPKLAERWLASADGRIWTFQLRQGVRFHDGTELDAAAVAFNFERARAFARFGVGSLIASIETPSASTIVFTLRAPYAPFLASLAT